VVIVFFFGCFEFYFRYIERTQPQRRVVREVNVQWGFWCCFVIVLGCERGGGVFRCGCVFVFVLFFCFFLGFYVVEFG
jgi:hypothetical protein